MSLLKFEAQASKIEATLASSRVLEAVHAIRKKVETIPGVTEVLQGEGDERAFIIHLSDQATDATRDNVLRVLIAKNEGDPFTPGKVNHTYTMPRMYEDVDEDTSLLLESVGELCAKEIDPFAEEMEERKMIRPETIEKLHEMGLMGAATNEAYGGAGLSFTQTCIAIERISYSSASVAVLVDVQNTLSKNAIELYGSDEQKETILRELAENPGCVAAFALSEVGAGSDPAAVAATAVLDGDEYILNGNKYWITNAAEAERNGYFIVFAKTDPEARHEGISAFIVPGESFGLSTHKIEKVGLEASSTCEVRLEDVRIPKANLLGEEGEGFTIAMKTLDEGRIGIAFQCLGIAQACLDRTMNYIDQRKTFGKSLSSRQMVQNRIANMSTSLEAARLLAHRAAELKESGKKFTNEAAQAKLHASETAVQIAEGCIELFGGMGVTPETGIVKRANDARIPRIYEGANDIQRIVIAREVMKRYRDRQAT